MACAQDLPKEIQDTLQVVQAHWPGSEAVGLLAGEERRDIKRALMDARRAGASWPLLGERLGIDAAALRSAIGCLPRWGKRPDEDVRGLGAGTGFPQHCANGSDTRRQRCRHGHAGPRPGREGGCGRRGHC